MNPASKTNSAILKVVDQPATALATMQQRLVRGGDRRNWNQQNHHPSSAVMPRNTSYKLSREWMGCWGLLGLLGLLLLVMTGIIPSFPTKHQ